MKLAEKFTSEQNQLPENIINDKDLEALSSVFGISKEEFQKNEKFELTYKFEGEELHLVYEQLDKKEGGGYMIRTVVGQSDDPELLTELQSKNINAPYIGNL